MDKDYSYLKEIDLKPCHCCGSKDAPDFVIRSGLGKTNDQFTIFCDPKSGGCGAHRLFAGKTIWYDTPEEAATAWNEARKEDLTKTNRQWMESLSDEELALFCSTGLYLKRKDDEGYKATVRISSITKRGNNSVQTLEKWFNEPQEFELIR